MNSQMRRFFKFLSSVKLAVPLMTVMVLVVSYGTIVESKFNTELARLMVYQAWWFQCLLGLLFINILFAALSRYPFKKHHTGFVITHIGLLTLLIGSAITYLYGIDGTLPIVEKDKGSEVYLTDLVVERVSSKENEAVEVRRSLKPMPFENLNHINQIVGKHFLVVEYLPFVKTLQDFESSNTSKNIALSFHLKSAFFDVDQWLTTEDNPSISMGPAKISLIRQDSVKVTKPAAKSKGSHLEIINIGTGQTVQSIPVAALKNPVKVGSIQIQIIRVFQQAVVGDGNKLEEGGKPGANPALELKVIEKGSGSREIVYAKFPTFSLHPKGIGGYKFQFVSSDSVELPETNNMPNDGVHAGLSSKGKPGGNEIEFHLKRNSEDNIELVLKKNGQVVLNKDIKVGETVQTPWMGIQVTLNKLVVGAIETQKVVPTELVERTELPPSAIKIKPFGMSVSDAQWLVEGQSKVFTNGSEDVRIYYGRRTIKLPFELRLNKFTKLDYPGTQTPMSFESSVLVNDQGPEVTISMNNPMEKDGYTLYQASYNMQPGQPTVSIFSVNRDPGRKVKYLGSLILVLGIVTYTLMRSRVYRRGTK